MLLDLKIEPSLFGKGLEAMKKALKSVDENAVLSISSKAENKGESYENASYLSDEDKESLKQTYELVKAGKMEFFTLDEVYESTQKTLEKYL